MSTFGEVTIGGDMSKTFHMASACVCMHAGLFSSGRVMVGGIGRAMMEGLEDKTIFFWVPQYVWYCLVGSCLDMCGNAVGAVFKFTHISQTKMGDIKWWVGVQWQRLICENKLKQNRNNSFPRSTAPHLPPTQPISYQFSRSCQRSNLQIGKRQVIASMDVFNFFSNGHVLGYICSF